MGREIRRVPKGWQHPVNTDCRHTGWGGNQPHDGGPCYQPMYDKDYETAAKEWLENLLMWEHGIHPERAKTETRYFWDYEGNPPDEEYYRPAFDAPAECYQIYETVSEGTPTSPVFETLDEIVAWLVGQGTSKGAAQAFAKQGYVPSMVMFNPGNGKPGQIWEGIESADKY